MDIDDLYTLGSALVQEVERLIQEKQVVRLYEQAFANVAGKNVDDVTPRERSFTKLVSFGVRMSVGATLDGTHFNPEQVQEVLRTWEKNRPQLEKFGVKVNKGKIRELKKYR